MTDTGEMKMKPELGGNKIIPVVVISKAEDTLPTVNALKNGGITIAEITFRTECAAEAIRLASEKSNGVIIGAGTVINAEQCRSAISSGAVFIVSPGFSQEVYEVCKEKNIPYLPGAVTATEIMNLIAHGITTVKFFPAEAAGGLDTIKALASAFPGIDFIPTGGINTENMKKYLDAPFIRAIGGSWMLKGTPEEIEAKTKSAVEEANR